MRVLRNSLVWVMVLDDLTARQIQTSALPDLISSKINESGGETLRPIIMP